MCIRDRLWGCAEPWARHGDAAGGDDIARDGGSKAIDVGPAPAAGVTRPVTTGAPLSHRHAESAHAPTHRREERSVARGGVAEGPQDGDSAVSTEKGSTAQDSGQAGRTHRMGRQKAVRARMWWPTTRSSMTC